MSGDAIPVAGVGHVRSPQVKEMFPTSGIGWMRYTLYMYVLRSDAAELKKLDNADANGESIYEIVTSSATLRTLYTEALSFFMLENVMYDSSHQFFISYIDDGGDEEKLSGIINSENLDEVRASILLMNYVSPTKANVDVQFASQRAKELWERAQKYLAEQEVQKESDPAMSLGNIISKLCTIHPSYNLFNVYDLTVFQLYDAFFQLCYMRSIAFSEAVVSNHGSKEFKYSDWMNPVKNYT